MFLPLKYPKLPSSMQQKGSKKDLWVISDLCSKDQILSDFSKFDLDLDQDHQIWSRSLSFRSLDQIFQCTECFSKDPKKVCSNHTCCYFVCGQHGSWLMRRMVIACPTSWNFRRKLFVPTWRLCVGIDGSGTTSRCFVYHKVILPTFNPFPASSWARGRRLASDYFVLMFQGLVTDTINYCFSKKKESWFIWKLYFS